MPNMSYCRFENTANDMRDCFDALLDEGLETLGSKYEEQGAEDLFILSKKFVALYEKLQKQASEMEEPQ